MGRQVPNKAKPYNMPNYPAQFPGLGGVSFQFLIEFFLKLSNFKDCLAK